ncbi:hypothetical protein D3C83_89420 [compost metagenome]
MMFGRLFALREMQIAAEYGVLPLSKLNSFAPSTFPPGEWAHPAMPNISSQPDATANCLIFVSLSVPHGSAASYAATTQ